MHPRKSPNRLPIVAALGLAVSLIAVVSLSTPTRSPDYPAGLSSGVEHARRVVGATECSECHVEETDVWQRTAHYTGARSLTRSPEARAIADALGIRRLKSDARCMSCHFTIEVAEDGEEKATTGVSCESCHGPARDWLPLHDDFGTGVATAADESPEHRVARTAACEDAGMNHTDNLLRIATRCFACHSIGDRELVEAGHPTGDGFELVAWSQGGVRHNFVRGHATNVSSAPERMRLMYVLGQLLDFEHAALSLSRASGPSPFADSLVERAQRARDMLAAFDAKLPSPELTHLLGLVDADALVPGGPKLESLAAAAHESARRFEAEHRGAPLDALEPFLAPARAALQAAGY
jgi:hypothetical protein